MINEVIEAMVRGWKTANIQWRECAYDAGLDPDEVQKNIAC